MAINKPTPKEWPHEESYKFHLGNVPEKGLLLVVVGDSVSGVDSGVATTLDGKDDGERLSAGATGETLGVVDETGSAVGSLVGKAVGIGASLFGCVGVIEGPDDGGGEERSKEQAVKRSAELAL